MPIRCKNLKHYKCISGNKSIKVLISLFVPQVAGATKEWTIIKKE